MEKDYGDENAVSIFLASVIECGERGAIIQGSREAIIWKYFHKQREEGAIIRDVIGQGIYIVEGNVVCYFLVVVFSSRWSLIKVKKKKKFRFVPTVTLNVKLSFL